jgi:putative transposase
MQYFKYKLKLNNSERAILSEWIGTNRCLYNLALAQRQMIDYREVKARSDLPVNYNYQAAELKSLKHEFEWFKNVPGQTLQQTLMQLDGAFKRFWNGQASFPQFKKKSQDMGVKIPKGKTKKNPVGNFHFPDHPNHRKGYIKLPKVDKPFRFHKHREMEGEVKAVTIRKESRDFYISVLCDIGDKYDNVKNPNSNVIGIDRGIAKSLAYSDGSFGKLPKSRIKSLESKIANLQVALARKLRFSNSWRKLKIRISKLHKKITSIRHDFLWKTAHNLSKNHAVVALEALKTSNMSRSAKGNLDNPGKSVAAKSGLNRAILREGWYMFSQMLEWECKKYGSRVIYVNPRNTSLTCSSCGKVEKSSRKNQARFECSCGFSANADTNAAINIKNLAAACSG